MLGKVDKETRIGLPPFCPILQLLIPSTASEYTVIDSFHLAEEICQQDPNLQMANLDVGSLFTIIFLNETIDICIDNLCNGNKNPPDIPKHDFRNLLSIAIK